MSGIKKQNRTAISTQRASTKGKSKKATTTIPSTDEPGVNNVLSFPIVGIGASAGGLEALQELFKNMPDKTGIAFVIVSHLDPSHVSLLPELIQNKTILKVNQVKNNMKIKPDCVYIIPPNKDLKIEDGTLHLMKFKKAHGANLPIDSFLQSLADDQGPNAIAIILSGTGSDGTLGVRAIKEKFGMVMVQNEESSKYEGMPKNAINTGLADYILSPGKMPDQLIKYTKQAFSVAVSKKLKPSSKISNTLDSIFAILHSRTNHDFSQYKKNTISRRIERRMNIQQIDRISDYLRFLQENEQEVDILFKELLIGVTNFFRDPDAFNSLRENLIEMLKKQSNNYKVRVWVPGCSRGEEVYSIAILLHEIKQKLNKTFSVQIFGTDIDEDAVNFARRGLYPSSISSDLTELRLKRYFIHEDDGQFRIRKIIREMVVFATQNIITDPPFTRLDLLSCRNLLIYLDSDLQKKLFPLFYYTLKPEGLLFLGSSETVGKSNDIFSTIDKKWKIFKRIPLSIASQKIPSMSVSRPSEAHTKPELDSSREMKEINTFNIVESILQESNTPPSAIIDNSGNIIYIHGRTGRYLEPPEGEMNANISEMARPGLKIPLISAIHKVKQQKEEVISKNLSVHYNGGKPIKIDLIVKPVIYQNTKCNLIMVQFRELRSSTKKNELKAAPETKKLSDSTINELERELQYTRENLQTTIEELETSNEELKSTNEELQSTNEELQSTNEEMETSKEELQSLNEESITVNTELQSRIDDLSQANDDMKNLLDSTDVATIFLDSNLCLRRFTQCVKKIVPLTDVDFGRPISHFANNLLNVNLEEYAKHVLDDLETIHLETQSKDGSFYLMRIRPYRTLNNVIDGVVITFLDITESHNIGIVRMNEAILREFMKSATSGFILLDEKLNQIEINDVALKILEGKRENMHKRHFFDIIPHDKGRDTSDKYLQVLNTGTPLYIDNFILGKNRKKTKYIELTAFKVSHGLGIIINDITDRKNIEIKKDVLIEDQKTKIKDQKTKIKDQKTKIKDQKTKITKQRKVKK